MTNRIIKTYGLGIGETPAEIIVTAGGQQVYSGTVPTTTEISRAVEDQQVLFEFELPVETNGSVPMTYQVTSGSVLFAHMTANYIGITNPIYTEEQLAILLNPDSTIDDMITVYESAGNLTFTQEEKDLLDSDNIDGIDALFASKNLSLTVSGGPAQFGSFYESDQRDAVYLGDELQTPNRLDSDQGGTWFWQVDEGSTMSFDLQLSAGIE